MERKRLIFVCSPFGGKEDNLEIARTICRRISIEGDNMVPIAPHLFFPEFLNEDLLDERLLGIEQGLELLARSDEIWIFCFNGITPGMQIEIDFALTNNIPIKYFYAGA